jgi:hypothetical protein
MSNNFTSNKQKILLKIDHEKRKSNFIYKVQSIIFVILLATLKVLIIIPYSRQLVGLNVFTFINFS